MKIAYTARKVNLKDNFKERVEKKLKKFERIFSEDAVANVTVTLMKNRQTVEITIIDHNLIYRAEKTEDEMNIALDKVAEVLGRQMRKNKTKLLKRSHSGGVSEYFDLLEDGDSEDQKEYEVARIKKIPVRPLTVDEAILEMNMVNHQFYMFINAETNQISVVYCRNNGDYGLLEPTFNR
ncbi:MAG: ribosome-associated translation inhibitor RaiA [Bacillota bacterium]|nr:ribosome-associated translation inhibitor RaiA [Bacillota bacterium]